MNNMFVRLFFFQILFIAFFLESCIVETYPYLTPYRIRNRETLHSSYTRIDRKNQIVYQSAVLIGDGYEVPTAHVEIGFTNLSARKICLSTAGIRLLADSTSYQLINRWYFDDDSLASGLVNRTMDSCLSQGQFKRMRLHFEAPGEAEMAPSSILLLFNSSLVGNLFPLGDSLIFEERN